MLVFIFHLLILIQILRVDKKFYRPATIRKWVVIIYESQQRFSNAAAERLVTDIVRGAQARGKYCMPVESSVLDLSPRNDCDGRAASYQVVQWPGKYSPGQPPFSLYV